MIMIMLIITNSSNISIIQSFKQKQMLVLETVATWENMSRHSKHH